MTTDSPSLADLRAKPIRSRPEQRHEVCLDHELLAQVRELDSVLTQFMNAADSGTSFTQAQRQLAEDAAAQRTELLPALAAASGMLTIRATPTYAEWLDFTDKHPARQEGTPGHERDYIHFAGRGVCNMDDLAANLAPYVAAWNGEPLAPGDWETAFESVAPSDRIDIAYIVVSLYLAPRNFTLRWSASPTNQSESPASNSPSPSESQSDDSAAGNPEPSSAATTETAPE